MARITPVTYDWDTQHGQLEVTDGDHTGYRGILYYDLAKMAAIRLAYDMSEELATKGVTALAITPGFLRSEAMLERFEVTEAKSCRSFPRPNVCPASEP